VALAWQCHGYEALLRLVRRAEALGYAAVFVDGDATQMGGAAPRSVLHGWTVTTALLAQTQRIQIGSIRLVHHWNAALLAQAATTAANLFGERFRFMISVGGHEVDRGFGLQFPPVSERVRWLDEMLAAVRALWRGERLTVQGEFVSLDGASVRPLPPPAGIPIAVAGRSPSLLALVAAHAQVWDVNLPPVGSRVEAAARTLDRLCLGYQRDPTGISRSMWIFTRAGRAGSDEPALRAEFRRLNPWFREVKDAELGEGLVAGGVEHCRSRLQEIRETLRIDLPVIDLSGLPEGQAAEQIEALAPPQSSVDSGT
jgi:alkanesulfonate monooxygenase SsuD/methylene tetrahydromethanopterin reductase-like flavin-dependent oxidoreductase (luciferase family)